MTKIFYYFSVAALVLELNSCSSNSSSQKKTTKESPIGQQVIEPKLYLEHSGSMFFYDGPNTNGDLKSCLVNLMQGFSKIKAKNDLVYIVNDSVYNYPKTFKELITSNNIFEHSIGNASFTDFEVIFKTILEDLEENQMAILYSDLIYSSKENKGKSAEKLMDESKQLIQLAFTSQSENSSILILKLSSDYKGKYYPYNLPKGGKNYEGSRPYYVCLISKNRTMERFIKEDLYKEIIAFEKLPNYENKIFFSQGNLLANPYYTILEGDNSAKGSFVKDNESKDENKNGLHAIKDLKEPRNTKEKLTLSVAISFPSGIFNESDILDSTNYELSDFKDDFRIKEIRAVQRKDGTTHKIVLEAQKKNVGGERILNIKFKKIFPPEWVQETTTNDDTNISEEYFDSQTFGFSSFITGLNNAYTSSKNDNTYLFNLKLKLNN